LTQPLGILLGIIFVPLAALCAAKQKLRRLEVAFLKRLVFVCVLSLVLITAAFAQEAPVTNCDSYAASDLDPQRKATGVPTDKINPALAVPACETAVRQYPNSTRLIYQLGRAYYKANNFPASVEQTHKAAVQGYALAQLNLGTIYESGHGVPQNYAEAVKWYRMSAQWRHAFVQ
jgi:tetratricopeptide (TPR) repeat protein